MNLTIGRPQTFQLAELDLDIEFGPRMLAGVESKLPRRLPQRISGDCPSSSRPQDHALPAAWCCMMAKPARALAMGCLRSPSAKSGSRHELYLY